MYENFVAQELVSKGFPLYYFNSDGRPAEVDFLIEKDGAVLPMEVKSGKSYKTHASLDDLLKVSDYGLERAFVLSNANVSTGKDGRIRYLPVYYLMFMTHDGLPADARHDPVLPDERDFVF